MMSSSKEAGIGTALNCGDDDVVVDADDVFVTVSVWLESPYDCFAFFRGLVGVVGCDNDDDAWGEGHFDLFTANFTAAVDFFISIRERFNRSSVRYLPMFTGNQFSNG